MIGAFHLPGNPCCDFNGTHVFRAFHWKVCGISGILKKAFLFSCWNFVVKKHVPFTSFHKESPVSGYLRRYLCHHLEFLWRDHKRLQLVSNKTRSSLDGPFHESFRKFLVNGKRPITSFWSKFLSCALFGYWAIQRRTSGLSLWYLNQLQRSPEVNSQSTSRTNSCSTSTPPAFRLVTLGELR